MTSSAWPELPYVDIDMGVGRMRAYDQRKRMFVPEVDALRLTRDAAGLTRVAMAEAMGVNEEQVERWERGRAEVTSDERWQWMQVTGGALFGRARSEVLDEHPGQP